LKPRIFKGFETMSSPERPTDDIFLPGGKLRPGALTSSAAQALEEAIRLARETRWDCVRSPHIFMGLLADPGAAARAFVEHWSGAGRWERIGERARGVITALVPKIRLEMIAARSDTTTLQALVKSPPPTTILVGERTRTAPRAVARQLARAFHGSIIVVPGAGHMIPLTHAAAVVDAVRTAEPGGEASNVTDERKEDASWEGSMGR